MTVKRFSDFLEKVERRKELKTKISFYEDMLKNVKSFRDSDIEEIKIDGLYKIPDEDKTLICNNMIAETEKILQELKKEFEEISSHKL